MTTFIRIEPSSSVPIYRQIIDQINYQIATGALKTGDKLPSVRELATTLAVNQNTILKVYTELCRENTLKIVRGDGTYVSSAVRNISQSEREKIVASLLRQALVQAIHLDIPLDQAQDILKAEYEKIKFAEKQNRSK